MHILHLLLFLAPDWLIFCHDYINSHRFSIYFLFLSGEGPTLKTLDITISVSAVQQRFYLYLNAAYAAHYVYFKLYVSS